MKKINLHDLIVSLQKKKIDLGPNPKETISMYSELGLIPPAKFKVLDSDASSPEILYPVDTLQKIIEIKIFKEDIDIQKKFWDIYYENTTYKRFEDIPVRICSKFLSKNMYILE